MPLATKNNCSSIFGISVLFLPGSKNHVGNIHVLYFYNFNTNTVIFSLLNHKPRVDDIEALIVKLNPPKDSLLVHDNCSPFTKGDVISLFKEHFNFIQKFDYRPQFGFMYLFHRYLHIVLSAYLKEYKKKIKSLPLTEGMYFKFEERYVDQFVELWSLNLKGCLKLVYSEFPNLKHIEELNMIELYDFDVEIIKKYNVKV